MKNESVIIDKKQVFLLFFSSIVIMILVFGTGVFFGKRLSGVATSQDKSDKVIKQEEAGAQLSGVTVDAGITDIVAEQKVENKKVTGKPEVAAIKSTEKKIDVQKQVEEKKVESKSTSPEEKKNEKEKPSKNRKMITKAEKVPEENKFVDITDAKFTLQVGAFPDRFQALKIAAELEKKGYDSWIQRGKSKNKDIFRVRIGKFSTKQDAEKFKQQFDKKEKYNSFITSME